MFQNPLEILVVNRYYRKGLPTKNFSLKSLLVFVLCLFEDIAQRRFQPQFPDFFPVARFFSGSNPRISREKSFTSSNEFFTMKI